MGVCTKEQKGITAAVLMATPCTNSLGGEKWGADLVMMMMMMFIPSDEQTLFFRLRLQALQKQYWDTLNSSTLGCTADFGDGCDRPCSATAARRQGK